MYVFFYLQLVFKLIFIYMFFLPTTGIYAHIYLYVFSPYNWYLSS